MSQSIFLPKNNSVNNVSALNYAVSPSYNTPRWLVRGQTAHILPPLLAHRLN